MVAEQDPHSNSDKNPAASIRLALAIDETPIRAIIDAAFSIYIPRIGKKPGPMLEDYAALIARGEVYCLLIDGKIAGTITLGIENGGLLVDNLAVAAPWRGNGYGKILLAFAETKALEQGMRLLRLYTNEAMTENLALYPAMGYVETHRAEGKGFRRVYFEKHL
jgi:GNAT superfamily N-acetyltransferase